MEDVVVVGGGLAGLAAGWRLRHWDTVLLESSSRVGGLARALLPKSDEEILRIYTEDLNQVLGSGFGGSVVEAQVQRWEIGDYLGTLYTETAISTGFSAAQEAASLLATERQQRTGHDLPLTTP
jgi:glycine/D-amino acid oxidase-like deaminating enzyme